MTDLVMGLIIGFVVGSVVLSGLMYVVVDRVRRQQADRLSNQEETISDLRLEMAEDRETNRRLRHQLHALSGGATEGMDGVVDGRFDTETLLTERDQAREDLAELQRAMESVRARLTDREAKLSEYREVVKEIRLSLEAQDRLRGLDSVEQDLPANARATE